MGKTVRCQECGKVYRDLEELEDLRDNDSTCLGCNSTIEVADWDRILASYEDEEADLDDIDEEDDWEEDEEVDAEGLDDEDLDDDDFEPGEEDEEEEDDDEDEDEEEEEERE
jgi:hypothetical protein